jgi:hypothetical protein
VRAVCETQARRHGAERLGMDDAGQMADVVTRSGRPGLAEHHADVFTLYMAKLHLDHVFEIASVTSWWSK